MPWSFAKVCSPLILGFVGKKRAFELTWRYNQTSASAQAPWLRSILVKMQKFVSSFRGEKGGFSELVVVFAGDDNYDDMLLCEW